MKLIKSEEVLKLDYDKVIKFYKEYVNPGQVKQISKFGFGKQLAVSSKKMIWLELMKYRKAKKQRGLLYTLCLIHSHKLIFF